MDVATVGLRSLRCMLEVVALSSVLDMTRSSILRVHRAVLRGPHGRNSVLARVNVVITRHGCELRHSKR